ncbi:TB2/DP1, HVA22 family-domain-containing protein [Entophlyctis helioformis]|nr:TB2/DP1, HVA22 family-domain-containing protein [Entophlyctis helioformis]
MPPRVINPAPSHPAEHLKGLPTTAHVPSPLRDLSESLAPYVAKADLVLSRIPLLRTLEAHSQVPKTYIALAAYLAVTFCLFTRTAAPFVSTVVVGLAWPLVAALAAVAESDARRMRQWLLYLAAFAVVAAVDLASGVLVRVVPLYYVVKSLLLVWLYHPHTKGASVVFDAIEPVIAPLLSSNPAASKDSKKTQ